jgi:hypothetical protein
MTLAGISISPAEIGRAHCRALMGVREGAWRVRRQNRSDPVRLGALQPWCVASGCPGEKHGAGAHGLESVELPCPGRRHCRLTNSHRPRGDTFAYRRPRPPRVKKVTLRAANDRSLGSQRSAEDGLEPRLPKPATRSRRGQPMLRTSRRSSAHAWWRLRKVVSLVMARRLTRSQSMARPGPGLCRPPARIRLANMPTDMRTDCGEHPRTVFSSMRAGTTLPLDATCTTGSITR